MPLHEPEYLQRLSSARSFCFRRKTTNYLNLKGSQVVEEFVPHTQPLINPGAHDLIFWGADETLDSRSMIALLRLWGNFK